MHLFEDRFRKRFVPHGDGYRFRDGGRGYVDFTRAEFEEFLALRRRVWSNPAMWLLYLLIGVALSAWLIAGDHIGGWVLAAVALVTLLVVLAHVDHKPHEVAQSRPVVVRLTSDEEVVRPSSFWADLFLMVAGMGLLFRAVTDDPHSEFRIVLLTIVVATCAVRLVRRVWRALRADVAV